MLNALLASFLLVHTAEAEVVLDGSMGTSGSVGGPFYDISATLGKQVGGNLFHSFSRFNVLTGEIAAFSGPNSVNNILARVTGGSASSIDGTIRSTIPGANFYLINPAGVMFGPNASLDVSGSFTVTTADYVKLSDGGRFEATVPENSVLTTAAPAAFGFLSGAPSAITFQGSLLLVPTGKSLSVVGGDITIENANLIAPQGTINLISAASAGEAVMEGAVFNTDSFTALGSISITETRDEADMPAHDFSGELIGSLDTCGDGGGKIFIRAGTLFVDAAQMHSDTYGDLNGQGIDVSIAGETTLTNWGGLYSMSYSNGDAGAVTLQTGSLHGDMGYIETDARAAGNAGSISVQAGEIDGTFSFYADTYDVGNGGDIEISADTMNFVYANITSSSVYGLGNAGNITLTGKSINLDYWTLVFSDTWYGEGRAGDIKISADTLNVTDGSWVSTTTWLGPGKGGDIYIKADTVNVSGADEGYPAQISSATVDGSGNAGNIRIDARSVNVTNGGSINSTSMYEAGEGKAGNIEINAKSVTVSGYATDPSYSDPTLVYYLPSTIGSDTLGSGSGGQILINADSIAITNSGRISSSTRSGSTGEGGIIELNTDSLNITGGGQIMTTSSGSGGAGTITVNAEKVSISGAGDLGDMVISWWYAAENQKHSGIYSNADSEGIAGSIAVIADSLHMRDGAAISSESSGTGDAGDIHLTIRDEIILKNAAVTTAAADADGGNIIIDPVLLFLQDSNITATVNGGAGNGGNISIEADYVVLAGSGIIANAIGGNGGNIDIVSDVYLATPDSTVSASSQLGLQGTVAISAPLIDLSGELASLPDNFIDPNSIMPKQCAESEKDMSTFVIKGRDGLPPSPSTYLPGL